MELIATLTNKAGEKYDFYVSEVRGKAFYNLLPHVQQPTDGGYFGLAYLFKIKGF